MTLMADDVQRVAIPAKVTRLVRQPAALDHSTLHGPLLRDICADTMTTQLQQNVAEVAGAEHSDPDPEPDD
jgi:hypothetical protein